MERSWAWVHGGVGGREGLQWQGWEQGRGQGQGAGQGQGLGLVCIQSMCSGQSWRLS